MPNNSRTAAVSTEGATGTGVVAAFCSSGMACNIGYGGDEEPEWYQRQDSVGHVREEDHEEDDRDSERPWGGHLK